MSAKPPSITRVSPRDEDQKEHLNVVAFFSANQLIHFISFQKLAINILFM
jgi:hypothetical protein